jgi:hypothetical protein
VERALGRDLEGGVRFGPRTIDLDIIFYENQALHLAASEATMGRELEVPHPRWQERSFVLAPLADLAPSAHTHTHTHTAIPHHEGSSSSSSSSPVTTGHAGSASDAGKRWDTMAGRGSGSMHVRSTSVTSTSSNDSPCVGSSSSGGGRVPGSGLNARLAEAAALWGAAGGERHLAAASSELHCVLPMGRLGLHAWARGQSEVMGVINVTPDSFSDGGRAFRCVWRGGEVLPSCDAAAAPPRPPPPHPPHPTHTHTPTPIAHVQS